jgi:hypothetical protein
MSNVQPTSLEAYRSLDRETRRQQVLDLFARGISLTDHEVSRLLHWPINCVTPRRNELVAMGKLVEFGSRIDPQTRKRCITWRQRKP